MHNSTTRSLFAVLFSISAAIRGEDQPRACKTAEQLIQAPGCRLTECRLGGFSTVLLGSEDGPRFETRGDLVMLDRECGAESTIPALFAAQKRKLLELGFAVEGTEQVKENYGSIVFQKDGQWLELTGLMLEGVPNLSVRSVRTDGKLQARRTEETIRTAERVEPAAVPGVQVTADPVPALEADQNRQPKILSRAEAIAPEGLEQAAAGGISVEVALDERGSIARILSTKGNPSLLSAALQAVRTWTFEPAFASGKPVPAVLQLDVRFKNRR
jgi:hypothetical protein